MQSLGERVLGSAAFSVGANIVKQSIGLVSMIVLARLLTPEDYGVVGAAMLLVYLFDVFSNTGINAYILSRQNLSLAELHSAWTLQFMVRIVLAACVAALSPVLSSLFEHEALQSVLLVCAAIPLIDALQSPGLLMLRRELNYRSISYLLVMAKIVGFIVSITIAIVYRSYWALVFGSLTMSLSITFFSYYVHPLRPKLTLVNFLPQWRFSRWLLLRGMLGYVRSKIDNFFVARMLGVTDLGLYTLSKQVATLPHEYLTSAVTDIFTSSIGGSKQRLDNASATLSKILVSMVAVMLPISCGLYIAARPMVLAVLGVQWEDSVPLIQTLCWLSLTFALSDTITTAVIAVGRTRMVAAFDAITLVLSVAAMILASQSNFPGSLHFAFLRFLVGVVIVLLAYVWASWVFSINHRHLLISVLPICFSTLIMAVILLWIERQAPTDSNLGMLLIMISTGLIVYVVCLYTFVTRLRNRSPELLFLNQLIDKLLYQLKARLSSF